VSCKVVEEEVAELFPLVDDRIVQGVSAGVAPEAVHAVPAAVDRAPVSSKSRLVTATRRAHQLGDHQRQPGHPESVTQADEHLGERGRDDQRRSEIRESSNTAPTSTSLRSTSRTPPKVLM
jgi:hypothetical protein